MSVQVAEEREMQYEDENNQESKSAEQQHNPQDKHIYLKETQSHQHQTHQQHINQHPHQHLNPQQARYQQHLQEKAEQQGFTEKKESTLTKFKSFVKECVRVLRITKKPTGVEFKTIVKVSGIGMLLIGLLGFIIQLIRQVIISF